MIIIIAALAAAVAQSTATISTIGAPSVFGASEGAVASGGTVVSTGAVGIADSLPRFAVILFIYLIVLVMNFFIPSGSAKAFMLIPIIVPMAQIFGISAQLCIVAFAFGDGFSNVMYPTNPALLISLGLADVSYGKWFKRSVIFQLMNLALTSAILLLGLAVGY